MEKRRKKSVYTKVELEAQVSHLQDEVKALWKAMYRNRTMIRSLESQSKK